MADFRQKDADREFRRGLEEFIDGCMTAALASRSSGADADGDEEEAAGVSGSDGSDQSARRRRRSDLEGEDLAETSAAARRHSRILSRWVARQAEEMMITSLERRNRESELLALARLHTVSMLDASFLRESRRAQQQQQQQSSSVERPVAAQVPSVLQRWRELEDESAAARDRRSPPIPSSTNNHRRSGGLQSNALAVSPRDNSEVASESNDSDFAQWPDRQLRQVSGRRGVLEELTGVDDRGSSREQSPEVGVENGYSDRERVRQIVRGWMTEAARMVDTASQISPRSENPRCEWLGERERQRVRMVREWVQSTSQQRDAQSSRTGEQELDGSIAATTHLEGQPERARRDLLRLRGRQARLDLIMRIVQERERELQGLSEHQAVSRFAHRNRIQSVLRGRFLRFGGPTEDDQRPSVADREIGQLRQRHTVSGLREGFYFRDDRNATDQASILSDAITDTTNSDNIVRDSIIGTRNDTFQVSDGTLDQSQTQNVLETPQTMEIAETLETQPTVQVESSTRSYSIGWVESESQAENWQEDDAEQAEREWQESTEIQISGWRDGTEEEYNGNWHENMNQEWPHVRPGDDGQASHLLEVHNEWHEDDSQEAEANWEDGFSESLGGQHSLPTRRVNRFTPPDDDSVYSVELRELLSRRSVSNLLHSGFRESLDQLIQSYIQRQGRDPFDWDLQRTVSNTDVAEGDQGEQGDDPSEDQPGSITRPPRVPPSPPMPPPRPLWHSELHHSWSRHGIHRSEIEWDIINDLRADMTRLQQVMSHMQRMLEACMDMQLELQRAVRQEVSAALNRSIGELGDVEVSSHYGTKWAHVRKGICCVCCDSHIDSLLYRCGHMCACSKCANELVRSGGKCPLCRAPIVEVIRAYSIM